MTSATTSLSVPHSAASRPLWRWTTRVLLVLVSTGVSVGALEAAVRAARIYPRTYPARGLFVAAPQTGYALAPNFSGIYWKGGRAFSVRTNAQGFRDARDFAVRSAARRVLVVGDSFVFGMPVEGGETFVTQIEDRLNGVAASAAWQVLNAGVPGYGTRQEALVLGRLLPMTAPTAVVLALYVGNDIQDNAYPPAAPASRAYHGALVTPEVVARSQSALFDAWCQTRLRLRALVLESIAEEAVGRLSRHTDGDPFLQLVAPEWSAELRRGWSETRRALVRIQRLCDTHHAALFVLVLPSKTEVLDAEQHADFARPRHLVLDLLAANHLTAIDSTPWLLAAPDRHALFETSGTHLLAAGNRIVGEGVANALQAALLPRGRELKSPSANPEARSAFHPWGRGSASPKASRVVARCGVGAQPRPQG
jgi:hypothetical protein